MSSAVTAADRAAARGLGFASLAIGLTEILMPERLERTMGIGDGQNTGILRTLGVREILSGIDILAHEDPKRGLWGRVAGDALDGVLLGMAANRTRNPSGLLKIAALVLPIVVLDFVVAKRFSD